MDVLHSGMQGIAELQGPDSLVADVVVRHGHAPDVPQPQLLRKLLLGAHQLQQIRAPLQQRAPALGLPRARVPGRQQEQLRLRAWRDA